jgi:hypothetical protein
MGWLLAWLILNATIFTWRLMVAWPRMKDRSTLQDEGSGSVDFRPSPSLPGLKE